MFKYESKELIIFSRLISGSINFFCQVVIGFLRIGEIDTMNEKFHAEIYIEAKWIDNSYEIGDYDPKKHWNVIIFCLHKIFF